ncbi:MAG TPA: hypothetical protein RMH99_15365 [Sandaracinaceae bacterium LLY-WYZ-13_1]|nr:hypothetical protein [Sandaracinaceae bacterium LLY-WYZ-13_1]
MARAKKTSKKTKRGSPEAIAKRRAARALNRAFEEGGSAATMDGRTLKRKKRLIKELKEGRRGKPLKAHEILGHVDELLQLGETLTSIRKMKPLTPPTPSLDDETVAIIRETHETYDFDPKAWKVLGVDLKKVMGGGSSSGSKKTTRKKTTRRKKKTSRTKK